MNCYRVTFLESLKASVDYWGKNKRNLQAESYLNFRTLHEKYYYLVKAIREEGLNRGIRYIWNFYEPYIEITFYAEKDQAEDFFLWIESYLKPLGITDIKRHEGDGMADWFCCNDKEREFGGKRHALSADLVALFDEYKDAIKNGKGAREQVKRMIHTISNPLGFNYRDEAYICFSRGLICVLFMFFPFERAKWIYTKIFRQKY